MNKLSNQQIKLDERDHVELPLLDQLKDLGLAVPFIVGAPQFQGDALAGFGPEAHAALDQMGGLAFQRWVRPGLLAVLNSTGVADVGTVNAVR